MPTRILSISGLRGIVGDGLEPDYLSRFARALGHLADGGTVVISRDGRASGLMVRAAVLAGRTEHVLDGLWQLTGIPDVVTVYGGIPLGETFFRN